MQVNDIYRDLAQLVDEQGESLDNIENNMVLTDDRVDSGAKQLVKASKYQKQVCITLTTTPTVPPHCALATSQPCFLWQYSTMDVSHYRRHSPWHTGRLPLHMLAVESIVHRIRRSHSVVLFIRHGPNRCIASGFALQYWLSCL